MERFCEKRIILVCLFGFANCYWVKMKREKNPLVFSHPSLSLPIDYDMFWKDFWNKAALLKYACLLLPSSCRIQWECQKHGSEQGNRFPRIWLLHNDFLSWEQAQQHKAHFCPERSEILSFVCFHGLFQQTMICRNVIWLKALSRFPGSGLQVPVTSWAELQTLPPQHLGLSPHGFGWLPLFLLEKKSCSKIWVRSSLYHLGRDTIPHHTWSRDTIPHHTWD